MQVKLYKAEQIAIFYGRLIANQVMNSEMFVLKEFSTSFEFNINNNHISFYIIYSHIDSQKEVSVQMDMKKYLINAASYKIGNDEWLDEFDLSSLNIPCES